jgi:hypothetical protein
MPKWSGREFHGEGAFIMKIATVGLDLAKTPFQVHGVDLQGHIVVRKQLRRADVLPFFAKLEPCVVEMRHVTTLDARSRPLSHSADMHRRLRLLACKCAVSSIPGLTDKSASTASFVGAMAIFHFNGIV